MANGWIEHDANINAANMSSNVRLKVLNTPSILSQRPPLGPSKWMLDGYRGKPTICDRSLIVEETLEITVCCRYLGLYYNYDYCTSDYTGATTGGT